MKNCASEYEKINEENKEENDADKSRQQCFKSLKKYAATKTKKKGGGQFLRMTTIANYYHELVINFTTR